MEILEREGIWGTGWIQDSFVCHVRLTHIQS